MLWTSEDWRIGERGGRERGSAPAELTSSARSRASAGRRVSSRLHGGSTASGLPLLRRFPGHAYAVYANHRLLPFCMVKGTSTSFPVVC